jgi:hypothetical protein
LSVEITGWETDPKPLRGRTWSRVFNGKDPFLEGVGGCSAIAWPCRDILAQLTSDIDGDPSQAQSIIIAELRS